MAVLQALDTFLAMSSMFGYTATLVLIPTLAMIAYLLPWKIPAWGIGLFITGASRWCLCMCWLVRDVDTNTGKFASYEVQAAALPAVILRAYAAVGHTCRALSCKQFLQA
jgi:hypothetical protein